MTPLYLGLQFWAECCVAAKPLKCHGIGNSFISLPAGQLPWTSSGSHCFNELNFPASSLVHSLLPHSCPHVIPHQKHTCPARIFIATCRPQAGATQGAGGRGGAGGHRPGGWGLHATLTLHTAKPPTGCGPGFRTSGFFQVHQVVHIQIPKLLRNKGIAK